MLLFICIGMIIVGVVLKLIYKESEWDAISYIGLFFLSFLLFIAFMINIIRNSDVCMYEEEYESLIYKINNENEDVSVEEINFYNTQIREAKKFEHDFLIGTVIVNKYDNLERIDYDILKDKK